MSSVSIPSGVSSSSLSIPSPSISLSRGFQNSCAPGLEQFNSCGSSTLPFQQSPSIFGSRVLIIPSLSISAQLKHGMPSGLSQLIFPSLSKSSMAYIIILSISPFVSPKHEMFHSPSYSTSCISINPADI